MEFTDAVAVQEVREGNPDAFRVLVERHSRSIFRLAYRMTGSEQDAEDMVQETFLRAYKQLHHFDGRAGFGTWLYRIAANCSLDFIRARKKRQENHTPFDPTDEAAPDIVTQQPAHDPSPERLAHSSEMARILGPAMDELSEMERSAFVLRHYEGLGMEEIGRALGVQPNAAKHSVFRAVQKLRRALEPAMSTAR
jgi:RNA polymerase sigma-70 factor (ECF subfamily)